MIEGDGDVAEIRPENIQRELSLVVGDLALSKSEDALSWQWPDCLERKPRAFPVITAIWRIVEQVARDADAELVLLDIGPNQGAINRAALIAADHVVVPLAPTLHSLHGLKKLGPSLRRWREEWSERRSMSTEHLLSLPEGTILPVGYVVMMHGVRESRPIMSYRRWINHIPQAYRESILAEPGTAPAELTQDDHCLALLKHHPSLMHMTMESRKPRFHLRPADGAIGAYVAAVQTCYAEFEQLARHIAAQVGVEIEPKRGYRTELG